MERIQNVSWKESKMFYGKFINRGPLIGHSTFYMKACTVKKH